MSETVDEQSGADEETRTEEVKEERHAEKGPYPFHRSRPAGLEGFRRAGSACIRKL